MLTPRPLKILTTAAINLFDQLHHITPLLLLASGADTHMHTDVREQSNSKKPGVHQPQHAGVSLA